MIFTAVLRELGPLLEERAQGIVQSLGELQGGWQLEKSSFLSPELGIDVYTTT